MMHNILKINLSLYIALLFWTNTVTGQISQSEIIDKIWTAAGGKDNWQNARYFMFSCIGGHETFTTGERTYLWDKQSGNCRFEGTTTDDEAIIVLFNTKTSQGTVYIQGTKLDSPVTTADIIHEVSEEFERDSHLLFLPTMLEGAAYDVIEEKLVGSQRFTVIHISTANPGVGAAHSGKLYIDTQTGRLQQWQPQQNLQFSIGGFKDIGGGLILPTRFIARDSKASVTFPLAAALINIEGQKFDTP